ncbi:MAG TPA: Rossmann-like and DUF2520 domain-containing protein [Candidatus Sulfotelmatobacter sp.]
MRNRPRVTIVGAGKLGTVLATSLHRAGYAIEQIVVRANPASQRKARSLAKRVGARAVTMSQVRIESGVVWFCVPDDAIAGVAGLLARKADWKNKVALHPSGALTSDKLAALRRRGARVASVHPMMTFVAGSPPSFPHPAFDGVPFAVEGDAMAVRASRAMVEALGGTAYKIRAQDKVAYHAWGTFASPLLTALLATTEQVAAAAGVKRREAKRRMLPILRQTLANYAALDAAGSFSGPIVRGDVETVRRHLLALSRMPLAKEVYVALARAAGQYLPGKRKQRMHKLFGAEKK